MCWPTKNELLEARPPGTRQEDPKFKTFWVVDQVKGQYGQQNKNLCQESKYNGVGDKG